MSPRIMTAALAAKIKPSVRRVMADGCDGDWGRVVLYDDGTHVIYNNGGQAARRAQLAEEPQPDKQAEPEFAPEAEPEQPAAEASLADARARAEADALQQRKPAYTAEPDPEPTGRVTASGLRWSAPPEDFDWASMDLDMTCGALRDQLTHGLPMEVPFTYHPKALGLAGMDYAIVEAALRNPQRVEVRPETRDKKYPVLAFHRGDVTTILGMQTPTHPAIIAAYAGSRLDPDQYSAGSRGRTGGGGARKQVGLPKSVGAMITTLRGKGADVEDDPMASTLEVTYRGQKLGKVNAEPSTPRKQIESDYQRMVRKMNGIDEREKKKASA